MSRPDLCTRAASEVCTEERGICSLSIQDTLDAQVKAEQERAQSASGILAAIEQGPGECTINLVVQRAPLFYPFVWPPVTELAGDENELPQPGTGNGACTHAQVIWFLGCM